MGAPADHALRSCHHLSQEIFHLITAHLCTILMSILWASIPARVWQRAVRLRLLCVWSAQVRLPYGAAPHERQMYGDVWCGRSHILFELSTCCAPLEQFSSIKDVVVTLLYAQRPG